MSLVNLAHVCSHLQNASRVRLGVTSIPVSKLHARLMLEMQKQGFIHSVILGGPSPPLPYKMRAAPQFEPEEVSREHIQENPWAAFPMPEKRSITTLSAFAKAKAEGKQWRTAKDAKDSLDIKGELQKEIVKDDIPEDYYEEEELEELEKQHLDTHKVLAASTPSDPHTLGAVAKSLSQVPGRQNFLNRPQPSPLKPLPKVVRERVDINDNVPEEDHVPSNPAQRRLWLGLKYWNSEPVISKMSLVSKPTKRIWLNYRDLAKVIKGSTTNQVQGMTRPGECIFVTTDRGIMEARECVERRIGGTVLCRVY